ncbi:DUF269 domain-containing protein [Mesorhizobium sp. M1406]|uniref:DUF269 domain-containing protein n=1 Tax=Mesorhizobium sp. M1406 TaxID=2957099 RepID=UPI003335BA5F
MSDAAVSPAVNEDEAALATPFVKCLVRLIRAQESYSYCLWEGKSDATLLADFIVTRKKRQAIPGMGYPDPDVLSRLDMFYTTVGLAIAKRFRPVTSPIVEMKTTRTSGPCFSRSGSSSFYPDVHRFGFETFRQLGEAGTKVVDDATSATEAYRDVARA